MFIVPSTFLWVNQNLVRLLDQVELSCAFLRLITILIYNQQDDIADSITDLFLVYFSIK